MSSCTRVALLSLCLAVPAGLALPAAATTPCAPDEPIYLASSCTPRDDASLRDTDEDGASDADERGDDAEQADSDGDGIPDFADRDDDGDGIASERERLDAMASGVSDLDQDGLDNWLDPDSDGDGVLDADEGRGDADRDGQLGYLDADEAGALDYACRRGLDRDDDGLGDSCDSDADGDGIEDELHLAGGGVVSCASSSGSAPLPLLMLMLLLFACARLARRPRAPSSRGPAGRVVALVPWVLGATLATTTALANTGALPGERFRPAVDAGGVLGTESAALPDAPLAFDAASWTGYALNPLVLRTASGERRRALVAQRVSTDVVVALSVLGRLQLGLDLPMVLFQSKDQPSVPGGAAAGLSSAEIGDLRLVPKVQLFREAHQLVDVAVAGAITLPTGALGSATPSEGSFTFAPAVVVGRSVGPVRMLANVGYRLREQRQLAGVAIGPELFYSAAVAARVLELPLRLDASLLGATGMASSGANPSSLELLGGVSAFVFGPIELSVGGGVGLLAGFGTPDARVFASVRYASRYAPERGAPAPAPAVTTSTEGGPHELDGASLARR